MTSADSNSKNICIRCAECEKVGWCLCFDEEESQEFHKFLSDKIENGIYCQKISFWNDIINSNE